MDILVHKLVIIKWIYNLLVSGDSFLSVDYHFMICDV